MEVAEPDGPDALVAERRRVGGHRLAVVGETGVAQRDREQGQADRVGLGLQQPPGKLMDGRHTGAGMHGRDEAPHVVVVVGQ